MVFEKWDLGTSQKTKIVSSRLIPCKLHENFQYFTCQCDINSGSGQTISVRFGAFILFTENH